MKQYFNKKGLFIFLGYMLIFGIIIYIVMENEDIIGALFWGFVLAIALFFLDSINPKYKKED